MKKVVVVIVAIVALAGCDAITEISAYNQAKDKVTSILRAPSTAKWPGLSEREAHVSKASTKDVATLESLGGERWYVNSYVDSENGFGGMGRTYWIADVRRYDQTWFVLMLHAGPDRVSLTDALNAR